MFYHVIAREGVIYETNSESAAQMIQKAVKDTRIRYGDLPVLRKQAEREFGRLWLRGPSSITKPLFAAAA